MKIEREIIMYLYNGIHKNIIADSKKVKNNPNLHQWGIGNQIVVYTCHGLLFCLLKD